jgi:cyanate lyase
MKREDLTEKLLDIKREKGWSWKHICKEIGGYSDVLIVGAVMGQMKLTKPQAANAGELFGLSKSEVAMLNEVPMRGAGTPMDFDMALERVANPKGDRVKITMSGKFLPYKYYGASGNVPEYGFKEE